MKLTVGAIARRALWEIDGRSGLKALRTPHGHVPIPKSVPTFAQWWGELSPAHRLRALRRPTRGEPVVRTPPDWHLEPHTGERWPADVHWTKATVGAGDLRSTWEVNRFGFVWDWIEQDRDAANAFEQHLADWRTANPFRAGINWASGQELALRALAILAGAAAWGEQMSAAGWSSLVELLYWHAVQIDTESDFAAGTVRNNHVLAEMLGLAAIGDALPGFDESRVWRAHGLAAFASAVDEQFFEDGGYCQHSHGYHDFALGLLFEADDWFPELRPVLRPVMERSLTYFSAIVERGGRAPNFGPNDRCRSVDYARLVSELARRCDREPEPRRSASFPVAGLHILRDDDHSATLRCGALATRAGHDDALNVEVWLAGQPVAVDAGSFCYRCAEHDYYISARSHNVVLVNQRGPRRLATRFTWTAGPNPKLIEFDARRGLATATYEGHAGVLWERRVRLTDATVAVVDHLNPTNGRPRHFTLQWLIDAPPTSVSIDPAECFTWNIATPHARITVRAEALIGALARTEATVRPASLSRIYGTQETVSRIELTTSASAVRFHSSFEPI